MELVQLVELVELVEPVEPVAVEIVLPAITVEFAWVTETKEKEVLPSLPRWLILSTKGVLFT